MSHATFTVTTTDLIEGSHDELAAKFIVDSENATREAADPPIDPLPTTPFADLVTSYLTILGNTLNRANISYVQQQANAQSVADSLDTRWEQAGEAERATAIAAMPLEE